VTFRRGRSADCAIVCKSVQDMWGHLDDSQCVLRNTKNIHGGRGDCRLFASKNSKYERRAPAVNPIAGILGHHYVYIVLKSTVLQRNCYSNLSRMYCR